MPPGPQDWWFKRHKATCGGRFIKVLEPPPKQAAPKEPKPKSKKQQNAKSSSQAVQKPRGTLIGTDKAKGESGGPLDRFLKNFETDGGKKRSLKDVPELLSVKDNDQREPFEESKIAAINKAFRGEKVVNSIQISEDEECKNVPPPTKP